MSNIKMIGWVLIFSLWLLSYLVDSMFIGVLVVILSIIAMLDTLKDKHYLVTYSFEKDGRTGKGCKCIKGRLDINSFISKTKEDNGFDEVIITYAKHITKKEYENFNK